MEYYNENGSSEFRETDRSHTQFPRKPVMVYILISVNIVVWVIAQLYNKSTGTQDANIILGAKINGMIMNGEYWRLLTPIFLHADIVHIALNSYSLYAVGPAVEMVYGRKKFLTIYLSAGIMGNAASFIFSEYASVGASGAIFGLMGALLYLVQKSRNGLKSSMGINIIAMLVLNIAYGFSNQGIDNFAHLGGLLGGYLMAAGLGLTWERASAGKKAAVAMVPILILSGVFVGFNVPRNIQAKAQYSNYAADREAAGLLDQGVDSFNSGNYSESEEISRKVLDLEIGQDVIRRDALDLLMVSLMNQGRWEAALQYSGELIHLDESRGRFLSGLCYLQTGDASKARSEVEKAHQADPDNEEIKKLLDEINNGQQ